MAVERSKKIGQGGVGGELAAGVAQEKRARVGVVEPFESAACGARPGTFGGSPRTVMTSRSPSIAASLPSSASVAPGSLRQGVSKLSMIASVGAAAQAAAISASISGAAPAAGRPRSGASRLNTPSASGSGLEIDKESPLLPKCATTRAIVGCGERERRLTHAERAGNDDGPVLSGWRRQFLPPILAADHLVGAAGAGDNDSVLGRELGEIWCEVCVIAETDGLDARRPCIRVNIRDEDEMLVAETSEALF